MKKDWKTNYCYNITDNPCRPAWLGPTPTHATPSDTFQNFVTKTAVASFDDIKPIISYTIHNPTQREEKLSFDEFSVQYVASKQAVKKREKIAMIILIITDWSFLSKTDDHISCREKLMELNVALFQADVVTSSWESNQFLVNGRVRYNTQ